MTRTLTQPRPCPSVPSVRHCERKEAGLRLGWAEAGRDPSELRGEVRNGEDADGAGSPQPGDANMLLGHPSGRGSLRNALALGGAQWELSGAQWELNTPWDVRYVYVGKSDRCAFACAVPDSSVY